YDGIGAWRTEDGKYPIDASGALPDGRTFHGPEEMKAILKQDREAFAVCVTEKMLTYALGRGLERPDKRVVREIAQRLTDRLSRLLKPLEPVQEDLLVLSGLAHHNANALGDGPGDHARAGACFLTGVHPRKTAGADIQNGVSCDQVAAQAVGGETPLPSLELGCEESRTVGNCDSGYSCAYTNSISWRSATAPMPPETNPRSVFERLFGLDDVPLS